MDEPRANGMAEFYKEIRQPARRASICVAAAVVSLSAIASCGNLDVRRERVSSGGLSETPEERSDVSLEANGILTKGTSRFTLAGFGDTVTSIAQRFGIDAEELARINGKHAFEPLGEGKVVVLPDSATQAVKSNGMDGIWTTEQVRYKVQRGDTAFTIARSFGVSARIIAEWNDLGPGFEVRENQILLIPLPIRTAVDTDSSYRFNDSLTSNVVTENIAENNGEVSLPPSPGLDQFRTETAREPRMLIPVNGEILNRFTGTGRNEGIDIAALPGTTVRAADDGTVTLVTRATDQTIILLMRHEDDIYTVYSNLENTDLKQNDQVLRGQPVGKSAGGEPPFVHFEVRIGANSVDPETYL